MTCLHPSFQAYTYYRQEGKNKVPFKIRYCTQCNKSENEIKGTIVEVQAQEVKPKKAEKEKCYLCDKTIDSVPFYATMKGKGKKEPLHYTCYEKSKAYFEV